MISLAVLTSSNLKAMTLPANSIELIHGDGTPTHSIIWLHGLGASANDFPPVVPELGLDKGRTIRFIFPQAPNRPITINGGMSMPGWYDIKGMSLEEKQDIDGMRESQTMLEGLIGAEIKNGIAASNIIVAGFSQGGAVAYYTVTRSHSKLAGVIALSTYLPFEGQTESEHSGVNLSTPILANHGTHDPVVPLAYGMESVDSLKQLSYQVEWKTYPMEHQLVMEQVQDIGRWINQVYS